MKLLFAATVAETLETYLTAYARHFRGLGWRVDALANGASASGECLAAFDRCWEASWTRVPTDFSPLVRSVFEVRHVLERVPYDLIHVHTPIAAFLARMAARFPGPSRPKILYTAHGFHFHPNGGRLANQAFLTLEKLAGRWTDCLIVINDWDARAARQDLHLPPARVRQLPGAGYDGDRFSERGVNPSAVAAVRRELGLASSDSLFLMVARCDRPKRPEDAVRALAACQEPDARLAIAGSGPLLQELRQLVVDLGVEGRVHLLGHREDIPALMKASVSTVLTSEREGLPLSVMESLSLGVPVIGSDIRGIRDLLRPGGGVLVARDDIGGMADTMSWMMKNPEMAAEMGRRGARGMERFTRAHVLHLQQCLYAEVLGHRVPTAAPSHSLSPSGPLAAAG